MEKSIEIIGDFEIKFRFSPYTTYGKSYKVVRVIEIELGLFFYVVNDIGNETPISQYSITYARKIKTENN